MSASMTEPQASAASKPRWGLRLLALALLQTAALGWLLWDRVSILTAPTEIRMTPQPVDPRDLFRGDYVVLRYAISTPRRELVEDLGIRKGQKLWVTIAPGIDTEPETSPDVTLPNAPLPNAAQRPAPLEESEDQTAPPPAISGDRTEQIGWRIVDVSLAAPVERPHAPELVLQGVAAQPDAWFIDYGIEWYFVPEGEGKRLETMIGDRALSVLLAVTSDGRAAIKALTVEGDTVYVEPLL